MTIEHMWAHGTGASFDDMSLIGHRWDSRWGLVSTEMDSHILLSEPGVLRAPLLTAGWLTGAWRSAESRVTFVADSRCAVHRVLPVPLPDGHFVDSDDFPSTITGVWGLDDEHVYAWGDAAPGSPVLYRWDGKRWHDMECPGEIYGMHGIAPDLIYAVGELGLVARWNGYSWQRFPAGTRARLASVYVVSPDEMYACGVAGWVVEGSVHGWVPRITSDPGPLYSIAKFDDRVLIAGSHRGLLELHGPRIAVCTSKIQPERLEAREQLIVTCQDMIYVTPDFDDWQGLPLDQFEPLVRSRPPAWITHPP